MSAIGNTIELHIFIQLWPISKKSSFRQDLHQVLDNNDALLFSLTHSIDTHYLNKSNKIHKARFNLFGAQHPELGKNF